MGKAIDQRQPEGAREKILVLEDSKAQAGRLRGILTGKGYSVTTAGDGVEGLYALTESRPGLIISDVWMPNLDGFQFCRTIKDDRKYADIPLILLTSLAEPKDIARGLNAGADYYLTKPYDSSLLLSMVDSILTSRDPRVNDNGTISFGASSRNSKERISAKPQQVINFLFSTYENLLSHNKGLAEARRELKSINEKLEEKIEQKTLALAREVAEKERAYGVLKRTLDGTVVALARAVEMKDPYTAGHQMRVGDLASEIARHLGFSQDALEGIRVMGLLHDLGKITIPAEILSKPSALTEYEFLFIKTHSQAGYDILKEIEFPWPVATAVLQHHERLNGSGYPLGLCDDEIIMEAKILAVADVAESMLSHRPYRPALGVEAALEEITRNKGILYAPEAADALVSIFKVDSEVALT
jgi:putative nucleotidyltransferase with HDIG domain